MWLLAKGKQGIGRTCLPDRHCTRMKAILPHGTADQVKLLKILKRLAKGAVKRPVRAAALPRLVQVKVRRNDPLAIGIEELERSFWPPARDRRRLSS